MALALAALLTSRLCAVGNRRGPITNDVGLEEGCHAMILSEKARPSIRFSGRKRRRGQRNGVIVLEVFPALDLHEFLRMVADQFGRLRWLRIRQPLRR